MLDKIWLASWMASVTVVLSEPAAQRLGRKGGRGARGQAAGGEGHRGREARAESGSCLDGEAYRVSRQDRRRLDLAHRDQDAQGEVFHRL